MSGPISGLSEFAELLLKLGKQERFNLAEVAAPISLGCAPGVMQIDVSSYCHKEAYRTADLASTGLEVTFVCCDQTLCNSSDFVSRDHIPHVGMRFTR